MIVSRKALKVVARSLTALALCGAIGSAMADAKQTVRSAVGKPLQAAQAALAAKKYDEAATQLSAAEAVGSLTPYEKYVITRLRASVEVGKGDYKSAGTSYEALLASGQMTPAEQLQTLEIVTKIDYSAKDYPKTIEMVQKYKAAGGKDASTLAILPQAEYLAGRYADAAKDISAHVAEVVAAGKAPTETDLQLLASCALKQNDMGAYTTALQQLVTYYPKGDYWLDLIARTAGRKGFSDGLSLDLDRLRIRTGTLNAASEYLEAAELAVQAGFPGEADQILKSGYERKVLGVGNPQDVDRQKRLQNLVTQKITADKATLAQGEAQAGKLPTGDGLFNTGLAYVTYDQFDKGLQLMQQGLSKGGLKNPDQARLHLGYAQLLAGKKDEAIKTFQSVKGTDGSKELAQLFVISTRNPAPAAAKAAH